MAMLLSLPAHAQQQLVAPPQPEQDSELTTAPDTIAVQEQASDEDLQKLLTDLLLRYPGVITVSVTVRNGIVDLDGQVTNEDVKANVTQFVRRVEGTRLVLNRMRTEDEVLNAWQLLLKSLNGYWNVIEHAWLRWIVGFAIAFAGFLVARLLSPVIDLLLRLVMERELLRSLVASLVKGGIVVGAILLSLSFLRLTELFLSIAGIAGIIGLTLGFAFRDIGENLIASLFLGLRRPFSMGDVIQVAGHAGVVQGMNMRATILVTFDGNYVRIPNGMIFKEIIINKTASAQGRSDADFAVPFEASVKDITEAVVAAVAEHPLVDADPAPRLHMERIAIEGVFVRAYYWHSSRIDPIRLKGDVLLRIKVALQKMNVEPPPTKMQVEMETQAAPKQQPQRDRHATVEKDEQLAESTRAKQEKPPTQPAQPQPQSPETIQEGENLLDKK